MPTPTIANLLLLLRENLWKRVAQCQEEMGMSVGITKEKSRAFWRVCRELYIFAMTLNESRNEDIRVSAFVAPTVIEVQRTFQPSNHTSQSHLLLHTESIIVQYFLFIVAAILIRMAQTSSAC